MIIFIVHVYLTNMPYKYKTKKILIKYNKKSHKSTLFIQCSLKYNSLSTSFVQKMKNILK